ncbi:MAG TPA: cytochrome c family protein, partial [Kiloniellales bacterium]|nr:cytochrome c family protein [Kiloniellales bacterium]
MSLEFNKIAGAVLTAGVVAMTTGFIANLLVSPASLEENAYPIAVSDAPADAPAAPEAPGLEPILPLLADADIAAGESAFRACAACHTVDDGVANRVGPNLWDIVGVPHAHLDDFNYSSGMEERSYEPWTYEALNAFI